MEKIIHYALHVNIVRNATQKVQYVSVGVIRNDSSDSLCVLPVLSPDWRSYMAADNLVYYNGV